MAAQSPGPPSSHPLTMPTVSVLIPCYNQGRFLSETLESLLAQTFGDWECLIVDDASTDDSAAVATRYAEKDARIRVLSQPENDGVAVARNRALKESRGRYILFLDADDLITPDYMALAVAALDADPALTLVYGKAERFGAAKRWDLPAFSPATMLASNCLYLSCFFRREAAESIAFDPAFKTGYEDWDFWLSMMEAVPAFKVQQLPDLCFRYRTRRGSRNSGVTDQVLADIRYRLWDKHRALYARHFCNPLETVEYKRLARAYKKAARMPLWRIRTAVKKMLGR